jgi:hypothetical protein
MASVRRMNDCLGSISTEFSRPRYVRITLPPLAAMTADIPDQQLRAIRHQREADADEDDSTPAATPASMGPPACSQPVPCRKLR